jgi:hypothetical protein
VKLEANMNMPGMVMNSGATIKKDGIAGAYQAHLVPSMAGDWNLILSYRGPQGPSPFPINVKIVGSLAGPLLVCAVLRKEHLQTYKANTKNLWWICVFSNAPPLDAAST